MMRPMFALATLIVLSLSMPYAAGQQERGGQQETWLPSLQTDTPQEGFELAVTLSRRGVTTTQSERNALTSGRAEYSNNPDSLIAASQVIAIHFQTIAAANDYWRTEERPRAE